MQLADVLILADKKPEAVALLIPLADQFARDGFAAKAVSVLKKIQKIDPGRRDVDERLARQIEEKQREAVVLPISRPGLESGWRRSASSAPLGPHRRPAGRRPRRSRSGSDAAPISARAEPARSSARRLARAPFRWPSPTSPIPVRRDRAAGRPRRDAPVSSVPPPAAAETAPSSPARRGRRTAEPDEIEDYDLLYVPEEGEDEEEIDVDVDLELRGRGDAPRRRCPPAQFADELMGARGLRVPGVPGGEARLAGGRVGAGEPPAPASQIVVSPLFRDFSVDEMVAVIQGLKLLSFERGEVIIREGQPGGSLYMLTSGGCARSERTRHRQADPARRPQGGRLLR